MVPVGAGGYFLVTFFLTAFLSGFFTAAFLTGFLTAAFFTAFLVAICDSPLRL